VERDRNAAADALSKLGFSRTQVPPVVFVQEVLHPSISLDRVEECNTLSQAESDSNDWREPIIKYIKDEEEPDDKKCSRTHCEAVSSLYSHWGNAIQKGRIMSPHERHYLDNWETTSG
jgi:hypothetical protein